MADDLTRIRGITKEIAERLAKIGVTTFRAIAMWQTDDVVRIAEWIAVPATVIIEQRWTKQAAEIEGVTREDGGLYGRFRAAAVRRILDQFADVLESRDGGRDLQRRAAVLDLEERDLRTSSLEEPSIPVRAEPSSVRAALESEAGQLVERIPRSMTVGVRENVEIRIGADDIESAIIGHNLKGRGREVRHTLEILESMSVELVAPDDGFDIDGASPITQLVNRDALKGSPFEAGMPEWGKWIWNVTPTRAGMNKLAIRVSAPLVDSRGVQSSATLPDRLIEISVRVNYKQGALGLAWSAVKVAAGGIVTAVMGILTKDYWWPVVEPILKRIGWL